MRGGVDQQAAQHQVAMPPRLDGDAVKDRLNRLFEFFPNPDAGLNGGRARKTVAARTTRLTSNASESRWRLHTSSSLGKGRSSAAYKRVEHDAHLAARRPVNEATGAHQNSGSSGKAMAPLDNGD